MKEMDALVVITADHGEEFWEHAEVEARYFYDERGEYGVDHGHNVFSEIVEVPLALYGFKGLRDHRRVSLADVTPTILDELGVRLKFRPDGVSLKERAKRAILTEAVDYGHEKKALYWGDFKFLYARDDGVKWSSTSRKTPRRKTR